MLWLPKWLRDDTRLRLANPAWSTHGVIYNVTSPTAEELRAAEAQAQAEQRADEIARYGREWNFTWPGASDDYAAGWKDVQ